MPELLAFPWPQRLQRMDRDHHGYVVENLRKYPAEMRVPGVAVNEFDIALQLVADALPDKGKACAQSPERRDEGLRAAGEMGGVHLDPAHMQLPVVVHLVVEAAYLDGREFREFAREIFDVDAGAAIHVWRIFIGGE